MNPHNRLGEKWARATGLPRTHSWVQEESPVATVVSALFFHALL